MTKEEYKNKVLGLMIGGAVGSALGYPVEFMNFVRLLRSTVNNESHIVKSTERD